MRARLDPLRYGLRALEEMAREQASVAPPAQTRAEQFTPHPLLRATMRDGAALSLRLFSDAADDATALVLGGATTRRFHPIPPRAGAFFEAYAAALASELPSSLTVGFPLLTFVQQGVARAAPLLSRGDARLRWKVGDADWKLPAGARPGAALAIPDALVLEQGGDDGYSLHAGVWHYLFGFDGDALAKIAEAGHAGLGALVRAATKVLEVGAEGAEIEAPAAGPVTREDLAALDEAALRRAPSSRALKCHPHGLVLMPPRGDPTSGLRLDLHAVLGERLSARGPLAVYLGAPAARVNRAPVFTSGKVPPTPSQLDAARAFEGSEDLVAVCGPPGCGKTALLHHVAAQTVVACALGKLWSDGPPARSTAWPLVVTSTNNAAVDHALAPFVSDAGLPIGIRLGNRRAMAESTSVALAAAIDWLAVPSELTLADARAAFEKRAATWRAFLAAPPPATTKKKKKPREPAAEPALDPGLYDAALAVRDAWARSHREALLPRLAAARDAVRAEWSGGRGKPLSVQLRELAPLFPVAGCTLLSMRASFPLAADVIDRLVIDEAAQCAPVYAIPALARARRAMFTGDVAQLPPVYTLDPHVDDRLANGLDEAAVTPFRMSAVSASSAQAVAEPRARARLSLTEHFRSQPEIVALASHWSGYTLDVRTPPRSLAALDAPVLVYGIAGAGVRAAEGVVNAAEAARAIDLVTQLVASGVAPAEIAVLTPFVGQSVRIERELVKRELVGREGVLVSTVHRLQGGERRVVVFSVTATERHHLAWLGDRPHLLHVATSRAQDHLLVLVDPAAAASTPALAPFAGLLR